MPKIKPYALNSNVRLITSRRNGIIREIIYRADQIFYRIELKHNMFILENHMNVAIPAVTAYQRKQLEKYGLSPTDYIDLLNSQGGVCAICKKSPGKKRLVIDHDHHCCPEKSSCRDCIRGLLCGFCNVALGFFKDDVSSLNNAVKYLENYQLRIEEEEV